MCLCLSGQRLACRNWFFPVYPGEGTQVFRLSSNQVILTWLRHFLSCIALVGLTCYVIQASLWVTLLQPPKCWDCRSVFLNCYCLAFFSFNDTIRMKLFIIVASSVLFLLLVPFTWTFYSSELLETQSLTHALSLTHVISPVIFLF